MKRFLSVLYLMVFLMGAGLVTWTLTRTIDETVDIGGTQQSVLQITAGTHDDVSLITRNLDETDTLKYEKTFRYNVKSLNPSEDYYLDVKITGSAVGQITIAAISPVGLQLTGTDQLVEITVSLIEGQSYNVGSLPIQFLFTAVEGIYVAPSNNQTSWDFTQILNDSNFPTGGNYGDGSFTNNGITFNYVHALAAAAQDSIEESGLMLRRSDEPSSISFTLENGLNDFSFDYRKAFTGGTPRTYQVIILNNSNTETYNIPEFGSGGGADNTILTFEKFNLNLSGQVTITIRATGNTGNQQATFNNIRWTENPE